MTRRALIALPVVALAPAQDEQDAWDAEMARDFAPGGAGEAWLEEIKADMRAGKFTDWDEAKKELGI